MIPTFFRVLLWFAVAGLGAFAYATLALQRGEPVNSSYVLIAALCTYAIGYRFYSKWIAARVLALDDRRATPCEVHEDGHDFVRTNKWIVFGHHFAAISGPGPLVGPVLAAQFGYLPGTLWILIGVALGGAVQDFVILFCSMRRDGRSLGQMVKEELSPAAGAIGIVAILAIMTILLAVLALVVVNALAESSWGVFTVGATIPIAMLMGGYLRYWRIGKVMEVTVLGVILLLLAVWGGQFVYQSPGLSKLFTLSKEPLAWSIILYGFAASVLPIWLLLAPRDYLSTFMKLGTIVALALGVFLVLPDLKMPPLTKYVDGSGLVVSGKLFPFCFITIACGAISGFHTLISSGITPKIITREGYARPVGYGAMCLESLVAIMAMIAACTLEPGVYLSMNVNVPGETLAVKTSATVARISAEGFPVSAAQMEQLAREVGETTLVGKTGGAATLAVGMAKLFSEVTQGRWLDLWYHFAIMFEALFILTTLDAGTRVGRYLIQDVLGHFWKPLGNTQSTAANLAASTLMVGGWGFFLIQGVRDPDGGVKALWPLFGIANQLLASIALCFATTVILKTQLKRRREGLPANPALAWVTLLPLAWLLTVTLTAGVQKVFHSDKRIGFVAAAHDLKAKLPALIEAESAARQAGEAAALTKAAKAVRDNRRQHLNNWIDAVAASVFLGLVAIIVGLSLREWIRLWSGQKPPELSETPPVWLPDSALTSARTSSLASLIPLSIALGKELSGQSSIDRAMESGPATVGVYAAERTPQGIRVRLTGPEADLRILRQRALDEYFEKTYNRGVRRCC
ncbi:MAG: carbon starvation protein A [Verrucomicrobia bacterium]|nr:carbon starvation protein A [Verrucomicrobiota bacterium]